MTETEIFVNFFYNRSQNINIALSNSGEINELQVSFMFRYPLACKASSSQLESEFFSPHPFSNPLINFYELFISHTHFWPEGIMPSFSLCSS